MEDFLSDVDAVNWILTTTHCLYALLRVSRTSSKADVRASYKRLALQCHPDKSTHPQAAEAFKKLNNAYSTLSNMVKREVYNAHQESASATSSYFRSGPPPPPSPHGCDLHEWFKKRQEARERRGCEEESERQQRERYFAKEREENEARNKREKELAERAHRLRQEHWRKEESAIHHRQFMAARRLQWLSRLKRVCVENEGLLMEIHIADWSDHQSRLMKEAQARARAMLRAMSDAPDSSTVDVEAMEKEVEVAKIGLREERLGWESRQRALGLDADTSFAGWERRVTDRERDRVRMTPYD